MKTLHLFFLLAFVFTSRAGVLEDYVRQPDDSFAWKVTKREEMGGLDVATLDLTSQTWRGGRWTHTLYIGVPKSVRHPSTAFLQITAGANNGTLNTARLLADRAGAIVAVLTSVPNQPLFNGRHEDQIIAYTFGEYLKTGDASWPLLLPMVMSAVRAMDAVQAWAVTEQRPKIERFVVSGASKRGWTTWLAAAADPRVCAIAPMVIDMLNMKAQTDWAQHCYGRQSEQIRDYTEAGLIAQMDTPGMTSLRGIVDPYSYRDRFTMPKLLLLGTNDRYWTVDALRHYWPDLPGPKLVYQAPNTGHGAGGTAEAVQSLAAFFAAVAGHEKLPQLEWTMSGRRDATIAVKADRPAQQALQWTATSPTRDFRDAKWKSSRLAMTSGGTEATARAAAPVSGYTAVLAELTFATASGDRYRLSTQVQVAPDN